MLFQTKHAFKYTIQAKFIQSLQKLTPNNMQFTGFDKVMFCLHK